MSARTPRKTFATPFVVTLAAALPAIAGCVVEPGPPPNPPAPPNPPGPQTPPGPVTPPNPNPTNTVVLNPPPVGTVAPTVTVPATGTAMTPPPSSGGPFEWVIAKNADTCTAKIVVDCKPAVPCNPPAPKTIACPANVDLTNPIRIIGPAGGTCRVEREMPKCAPGVHCNPPPPQTMPCP